ncbi:YeeE/YedE family protein [Cycloclasticus sp. P1]|uniref:YeeE/YedE family protein n=1 Tax=Cycloclasticus sp. (strain P1) TaxID=385025 RepID=UPI000286A926|nr:YeeE/YedE family protein [Cycloclasticus sp. P1]AFT66132.1 Transporter component-like protein [Cycloclasticus sp. P1]
MLKILSALVAGVIFGVGLALSQMVNPNKVINFLDITGQWDPSLMFVLGGAVLTTTLAYRFIFSRGKPLLADDFQLPTVLQIDRPLIIGAALFGIGWGVIGYCPGPAVASLGFGFQEPLLVVVSMLVGMLLYKAAVK